MFNSPKKSQYQTYSRDLENSAILNVNQSFNQTDFQESFVPEVKGSWIDTIKGISVVGIIILIIFPIAFIVVGVIHKDHCLANRIIPLWLTIFGAAILLNLFLYAFAGATYLALLKKLTSFSFGTGAAAVIASILAIVVGTLILGWWIYGTFIWIQTMLSKPQFHDKLQYSYCDPIVYWTALAAIILGIIGGIVQLCIAVGSGAAVSVSTSRK